MEIAEAKKGPRQDPAQRWLDFGSWLSGEVTQGDFAARDGVASSRYHQLFTRIMDVYFQDIRQDSSLCREPKRSEHPRNLPLRRATLEEAREAIRPLFVKAMRLAFSGEDLGNIAAHQPQNIYKLVKRLRADFEGEELQGKRASSYDDLRVLHVEDSAWDAELIQNLLLEEWPHCQFQRVWNRADFEDALQQDEFNLILSDHSMPSFDGLTALALARQHRPEKPFIFLSGTLGEARAAEAMQRGATDYIVKDHPVRLISAIRDALE